MRIARRLKTNSATILIVTLWIMTILTLLALGIGRQTRVDLAFSKYKLGKMRSKYAAWSAAFYGIDLLSKEIGSAADEEGAGQPPLAGLYLSQEQSAKDLFAEIGIPYGSFDIRQTHLDPKKNSKVYYGFSDEQSRLDLNALTLQNAGILKELILLLGYDEQTAETVSISLVDWMDADANLADRSFGAEEEYYQQLERPYHCKNMSLESVEELFSVRGMSDPLWHDLKPYVTIFPSEGTVRVNFSMAPEILLLAMVRHFTGSRSNTDVEDADSLVRKILEYRCGADGQATTSDDRPVVLSELVLNAKEKTLASFLIPYEAKGPGFIRMEIEAVGRPLQVATHVSMVVRLSDLSVVFWRRDGEREP